MHEKSTNGPAAVIARPLMGADKIPSVEETDREAGVEPATAERPDCRPTVPSWRPNWPLLEGFRFEGAKGLDTVVRRCL